MHVYPITTSGISMTGVVKKTPVFCDPPSNNEIKYQYPDGASVIISYDEKGVRQSYKHIYAGVDYMRKYSNRDRNIQETDTIVKYYNKDGKFVYDELFDENYFLKSKFFMAHTSIPNYDDRVIKSSLELYSKENQDKPEFIGVKFNSGTYVFFRFDFESGMYRKDVARDGKMLERSYHTENSVTKRSFDSRRNVIAGCNVQKTYLNEQKTSYLETISDFKTNKTRRINLFENGDKRREIIFSDVADNVTKENRFYRPCILQKITYDHDLGSYKSETYQYNKLLDVSSGPIEDILDEHNKNYF